MRITSKVSAVISDAGFLSLTPGETIDLPDEIGQRLIDGGLADIASLTPDETIDLPDATKRRAAKKITAAPENKAG
jgi:hypothetical protein